MRTNHYFIPFSFLITVNGFHIKTMKTEIVQNSISRTVLILSKCLTRFRIHDKTHIVGVSNEIGNNRK